MFKGLELQIPGNFHPSNMNNDQSNTNAMALIEFEKELERRHRVGNEHVLAFAVLVIVLHVKSLRIFTQATRCRFMAFHSN